MNDLIKDINHDIGEFIQFTMTAYDKAIEGVSNTVKACSIVVAPPKKNIIQVNFDTETDIEKKIREIDEQWHIVQEPEWTYEHCSMGKEMSECKMTIVS